jgi:hypothetical protein
MKEHTASIFSVTDLLSKPHATFLSNASELLDYSASQSRRWHTWYNPEALYTFRRAATNKSTLKDYF